jgi:hypothetical protein
LDDAALETIATGERTPPPPRSSTARKAAMESVVTSSRLSPRRGARSGSAPSGAPPRRGPRQLGPRTPSGPRRIGTTRRWWRRLLLVVLVLVLRRTWRGLSLRRPKRRTPTTPRTGRPAPPRRRSIPALRFAALLYFPATARVAGWSSAASAAGWRWRRAGVPPGGKDGALDPDGVRLTDGVHRRIDSLFVWLVADGWCWFVLREKYCWLVADGWFFLRQKYCWLVTDKPSEQGERSI